MWATRIIAIRHGETAWNLEARLQGQLDIPLNAVGRRQAATLADALRQTGFEPFPRGILPGWDDIVRFKILKKLGIRNANAWQRLLPWTFLARLADKKYGLSAQPLGRAI